MALAATWIVQPLAEHARYVEIDQQQLLFEGLALTQQLTTRIEDQAGAIEHKLILPADHVHVRNDHVVIRGAGGQHLLAEGGLLVRKRRRVYVHDQLGASQRLSVRRSYSVPDVLAHVDAEPDIAETQHRRFRTGSEISILVEYAIRWQELLVVQVHHMAAIQDGSGVEDVVLAVDTADDGHDVAGFARDLVQDREVVADERWF